jgi:serine/threonine protein phosphatase PrpC
MSEEQAKTSSSSTTSSTTATEGNTTTTNNNNNNNNNTAPKRKLKSGLIRGPIWTLGLGAVAGVLQLLTSSVNAESAEIARARTTREELATRDAAGAHTHIGKRDYQEDRHVIDVPAAASAAGVSSLEQARQLGLVVGVFDGHGGSRAAHFAANALAQALRKTVLQMPVSAGVGTMEYIAGKMLRDAEAEYDTATRAKRNAYEGCTVLLAAIRRFDLVEHVAQTKSNPLHRVGNASAVPPRWLDDQMPAADDKRALFGASLRSPLEAIVANVGDSRCVLCRRAPPSPSADDIELSKDHKPERPGERYRIEELGGQVVRRRGGDVYRVYDGVGRGGLAMARAFGDAFYSEAVPPSPEITVTPLSLKTDLALVLATDGVWDTLDKHAVCNVVRDAYRPADRDKDALAARTAKRVVDEALARGSTDNCTAVVVLIGAKGPNDK